MVGRIYDHLVHEFGSDNIFLDVEGIHGGEQWRIKLEQQIRDCDVLLAVVGEQWMEELKLRESDEDMVKSEIRMALDSATTIIPVPIAGARTPKQKDLPPEIQPLADFHSMPVRPGRDFRNDVELLSKAIRRLEASGKAETSLPPKGSPLPITKLIGIGLVASMAIGIGMLLTSKSGQDRSLDEPEPPDAEQEESEVSFTSETMPLTDGGELEVRIQRRISIGDQATLILKANRDAFVRVMHVSSDNLVSELFPGTTGESGKILAEEPRIMSWRTTPPAGMEKIVVYSSSEPIDSSAADGAALFEAMREESQTPLSRGVPAAVDIKKFPVLKGVEVARVGYDLTD